MEEWRAEGQDMNRTNGDGRKDEGEGGLWMEDGKREEQREGGSLGE